MKEPVNSKSQEALPLIPRLSHKVITPIYKVS
jgi:hypothetical protein